MRDMIKQQKMSMNIPNPAFKPCIPQMKSRQTSEIINTYWNFVGGKVLKHIFTQLKFENQVSEDFTCTIPKTELISTFPKIL
jgi:hypothetical protein